MSPEPTNLLSFEAKQENLAPEHSAEKEAKPSLIPHGHPQRQYQITHLELGQRHVTPISGEKTSAFAASVALVARPSIFACSPLAFRTRHQPGARGSTMTNVIQV